MSSYASDRTTALSLSLTHWYRCDISRHRLPKGQRWVMPTCAGVYAIYENGALAYIGSSGNLRSRLRSHLRSGRFLGVVTVKVKHTTSGLGARIIERRIVTRLRPRKNLVINISPIVRGPGSAYGPNPYDYPAPPR